VVAVAADALPAGSVAVVEIAPELCGVAEVIANCPLVGTMAVPEEPSGNVTFTVEPGSAVPATVNVPFGLAVVAVVGAIGGVASVKGVAVTGETLPAGSFTLVVTGPEVCWVGDMIAY
jgi:hypothetical protein